MNGLSSDCGPAGLSQSREQVLVPGHATRRRCGAGRHGAQCRQLCQWFPLQGPSGVWGQRLVQLRRACWATARTLKAGSLGPPLTRSDGASGPTQVPIPLCSPPSPSCAVKFLGLSASPGRVAKNSTPSVTYFIVHGGWLHKVKNDHASIGFSQLEAKTFGRSWRAFAWRTEWTREHRSWGTVGDLETYQNQDEAWSRAALSSTQTLGALGDSSAKFPSHTQPGSLPQFTPIPSGK
ncbi:hypothetical protein NN561_007585 [Cricetulus griseus]